MPTATIPIEYKQGFRDRDNTYEKLGKGLSEGMIRQISQSKNEPAWMEALRLVAFRAFLAKPIPEWGPDLSKLNFADIICYSTPIEKKVNSWRDLPANIRKTYQKIGVPEWEKDRLAGVEAQYDSQAIYGSIKKKLDDQGVIFTDSDSALKKYPELFHEYFGKLVSIEDNKFAALNAAFWSGGSFVYIPKGVKVKLPLQAYFRINARSMGQFERTIIIADDDSHVKYIEGCSAPIYNTASLHAAVVEVFVKKQAKVEYVTIQNWSNDVYNLVTKRAHVEENGVMSWTDVNIGSKLTMKYPSCVLKGNGAKGELFSFAVASDGQQQDSGAKMIHLAPCTTSNILSKSLSLKGGKATFRGLIKVGNKAKGSRARSRCESLIVDENSRAESLPTIDSECPDAVVEHEAVVFKPSEEQLFYLQSRGLSLLEAESLMVNGFADPVVKKLPFEYALEIRRLIENIR